MSGRVLALSGGVGGAKLVLGLRHLCGPGNVTAIVNTGDDFDHMGLYVSPDVDTLLYTLSGQSNRTLGWGRESETWSFMAAATSLGAPDWFRLGDGDLALHVLRTQWMHLGETLSTITARFAEAWNVGVTLLPMSDRRMATLVETEEGVLPFQDYFVRRRCEPAVRAIRFEGADTAAPAPGVLDAILSADHDAIILAPSNPFLSIDPILALPGVREALVRTATPIVAVSPLVGGQAVKGPTDKLMRELGLPLTHSGIMRHYGAFLDGIVVDAPDEIRAPGDLPTLVTDTMMVSLEDRIRVARAACELARTL